MFLKWDLLLQQYLKKDENRVTQFHPHIQWEEFGDQQVVSVATLHPGIPNQFPNQKRCSTVTLERVRGTFFIGTMCWCPAREGHTKTDGPL